MNEKILTFVWLNRLFDSSELFTTEGEIVSIIKTGLLNTQSGPDITDAQIRIGSILWVGNVEFHVKSSHWKLHHHDGDPAYSNIILHVVFEDDLPLRDNYGKLVSTLILHFSDDYLQRYEKLMSQKDNKLCAQQISRMDGFTSLGFLTRLALERLESKTQRFKEILSYNHNDWYQTFWQILARNFGFGKNNDGFELTAKALPYKLILKNFESFQDVLSMLMGQAGFLDSTHYNGADKELLTSRYRYNQLRYNLEPMNTSIWKFSGFRPQNSPFVRMRQLAAIITKSQFLMSELLECKSLEEFIEFFNFQSNIEIPALSISCRRLLIINLVCPLLVLYSQQHDHSQHADIAVSLLEELPSEENSIVKRCRESGMIINDALGSQACLQLQNSYCQQLRCIECQIGRIFVSRG